MRKLIAAATFGLVLGVAGASNPADQSPEARAYFGFNFGGVQAAPRNFHYGLRIDHDSRYVQGPVPAMVQIDFTRAGFNLAKVNGMNVARQQYKLRQAEEPAAEEEPVEEEPVEETVEETPEEEAPAEEAPEDSGSESDESAEGAEGEQGFLSKTWSGITGFFGGLFGGGDEEATETAEEGEGATEEAAADAGETADGPFANYGVVDWGLLALGAVGLGYAVGEVSNAEESDDPAGPTPPPPPPPVTVPPPVTAPPVTIPVITYSAMPVVSEELRERMEWLDGGTGQMGDLLPQDE